MAAEKRAHHFGTLVDRLVCRVVGHRRAYPWFLVNFWVCRRCGLEGGVKSEDVAALIVSARSRLVDEALPEPGDASLVIHGPASGQNYPKGPSS